MEVWLWGSGFGVWGLVSGDWGLGLGCRAWGFELQMSQGMGVGFTDKTEVWGSGFGVTDKTESDADGGIAGGGVNSSSQFCCFV